jgi:hypothetical protein
MSKQSGDVRIENATMPAGGRRPLPCTWPIKPG